MRFFRNSYGHQALKIRVKGFIERILRRYPLCSSLPVTTTSLREKQSIDRPIFIVGCGRSGTSMLFSLLSEHSSLLPTNGFPDGEDSLMWAQYGGAFVSGFGGTPSRTPVGFCHCLPMTDSDVDDNRSQFFTNFLINKYPQIKNGQKRLLNKNPHLSNKIGYLLKLFPDAIIIHIIRDPYSVIASWKVILKALKNVYVEIPEAEDACMNIYPGRITQSGFFKLNGVNKRIYNPLEEDSLCLLAEHWLNINTHIRRQSESNNNCNIHHLKYENLFADQTVTMNRTLEFCDLPGKENWSVRVEGNPNQKWRSQLNRNEISIINQVLSGRIESLGYQLEDV